jgi:hypothetical protein
MKFNYYLLPFKLVLLSGQVFFAQEENNTNLGNVSGNIQSVVQYYNADSLINAANPDHKMGANSFVNLNYNKGNFNAGIRYESYLNPLEGYPTTFQGTGLGYRYANWRNEDLEVTVGHFYEQFGTGMILRVFEERQLGIDNALDGIKLKYNPYKGIYLKGLIGKQRHYFQDGFVNGTGIVRGFDAEVNLNELLDSAFADSKLKITIGGSFVSKFNNDNRTQDYILPKNVGAYSGRVNLRYGKFRFSAELMIKENDPYPNPSYPEFDYIYNKGKGALINLGYSTKGFSVDLTAKHNDNVLWRSSNVAVGPTDLMIGFLPTLSEQHTYALAGTLYPYASNPNGEIGYQALVLYKFPKDMPVFGGKYPVVVSANFATAYAPQRTFLNDDTTTRLGYDAKLFRQSDSIFFHDINFTIEKKFSKSFKAKFKYFNFLFDDRAILVAKNHDLIFADIFVLDLTYNINKKHTLKFETQALLTQQDQGNWVYGMIEYTYSPHWFVAILDQYNVGNPIESQQIHYLLGTAGYIKGPHRFSIQYGRQRAGVFCVGGVCRQVPASNGFTFMITSSF